MNDSPTPTISPISVIKLLSRGVLLELIRKKDLYVVGMLMGLFLIGAWSVSLVGIESDATATFLLNLGLTLTMHCIHLLSLFLTIRQIPIELENRTLFPLLARPFERRWYLIGKWCACTAPLAGLMLVISILVIALVPGNAGYDSGLMIQMLLAQILSLAALNALAILLSILIPRSMGIMILGGLYLAGDKLIQLLNGAVSNSGISVLIQYLSNLTPDFSKLNLITRYTDGISSLSAGTFLGIVIYALLLIALSLMIAGLKFERRNL